MLGTMPRLRSAPANARQTACIDTAAAGICGAGDFKCMCSKNSTIRPKAEACVNSKCGAGKADEVLNSVAAFCKCVGAPVS